MTTRADPTPQAAEPAGRGARRWVLVGLALAAVAAVSASLLLTVGPMGGHGGDQVAEPSPVTAEEGLTEATTQIHGHLNWLIWGSDDASLQPGWTELVDETIVRADAEERDELVRVLRATRDLVLREQALRRAHDLAADAETLAHGGEIERDARYLREVDGVEADDAAAR